MKINLAKTLLNILLAMVISLEQFAVAVSPPADSSVAVNQEKPQAPSDEVFVNYAERFEELKKQYIHRRDTEKEVDLKTENVFNLPSQTIRELTKSQQSSFYPLESKLLLVGQELGVLDSLVEYIREQWVAENRSENRDGEVIQKLFLNYKFRAYLWNSQNNFYRMLVYAKKGYLELAYNYRDFTWVSLLDLVNIAAPKISLKDREKFLQIVILSVFQWAHTQAGPAKTYDEKKKTDFIITEFYQLFDVRKNGTYLRSIYERWSTEKVNSSFGKGMNVTTTLAFVTLGLVFAEIIMENPPEVFDTLLRGFALTTVASLFTTPFLHYWHLRWLRPLNKVRFFKKMKFDLTVDSFLKYDLDPEVLSRLQSVPTEGRFNVTIKDQDSETLSKEYFEADKLRWLNVQEKVSHCDCSQTLFAAIQSDSVQMEKVSKAIEAHPELQAQAQLGHEFKNHYLKTLQQTFGSNNFSFVVDPETEILRDLLVLQKIHVEQKTQPIKIKQAEVMALEETRTKFGLSENLELSDLEVGKNQDANLWSAFIYFKKRFFSLQNAERIAEAVVPPDMEAFKKQIENKIEALRQQNFRKGLSDLSAKNPALKELKLRTTKGLVTVTIDDLKKAEIDFAEGRASELSPRFHGDTYRLNDGLLVNNLDLGEIWGGGDFAQFKDVYKVVPIQPVQATKVVQVKIGTETLAMTEIDFSQLLFEMSPKYYSYNETLQDNVLFQVETPRRDALLADTSMFLASAKDQDPKALIQRLKIRLAARTNVVSLSKTFSEELRDQSSLVNTESVVNDIRWLGYSTHPDFWRLRDMDQKQLKERMLDNINDLNLAKLKSPEDVEKAMAKLQKRESKEFTAQVKRAGERFYNADKKRILRAMTFALVGTMIAGGALGTKQLLSNLGPSSASKSSAERAKKFQENRDSLNFQMHKPKNFSKDVAEELEKEGVSPFELERRTSGQETPYYLNLPVLENLPADLATEEKLARDGKAPRLEVDPTVWTSEESDLQYNKYFHDDEVSKLEPTTWWLRLSTLSAFEVRDGFMPIPSMAGYRVHSIKIYEEAENSQLEGMTDQYEVYFDRQTGLSYLRFFDHRDGQFRITVKYKKSIESHSGQSHLLRVDSQGLTTQINDLQDLGATAISEDLAALTKRSSYLGPEALATQFGASGIYTYDSEATDFSLFSRNPYKDYKKFLRNGVFYYQCSGSNSLFAAFLGRYYQQQKAPVAVTNLVGFTLSAQNFHYDVIVNPVGHMHTMAYATDRPYHYLELDATPSTMDPKYEKSQKFPEPNNKKEQKRLKEFVPDQHRTRNKMNIAELEKPSYYKDQSTALLRPRRPRLVPKTIPENDSVGEGESKIKDEAQQTAEKNVSMKREKKAATLEEFETLTQSLKGLIPKISSRYPLLQQVGRKELLGLGSLSLMVSLRQYLRDPNEAALDQVLRQAMRLQLKIPVSGELSARDSMFIEKKTQEALLQKNGNKHELLAELLGNTQSGFRATMTNYRTHPSSSDATHAFAYLKDTEFILNLNQFLDFLANRDFHTGYRIRACRAALNPSH